MENSPKDNTSETASYDEGFADTSNVIHDNDDLILFHEVDKLSDNELLGISQEFGTDYVGLLNGRVETELQNVLAGRVSAEMHLLLDKIEGLGDVELSKVMIEGYRSGVNNLHTKHGKKPVYDRVELIDTALSHVTRVVSGPFGIPIIYTDGHNEELFAGDALSFASSEVMIENKLPPLVVVCDGYNSQEKQKVTTHETSHAVYALLSRAGIIPFGEGDGAPKAGQKSAFDLARDEAIAQMVADQNSAIHPDVMDRMRQEMLDEDLIIEYREALNSFRKSDAEKSGLQFSDAILGVMMARSFSDLNAYMFRMSKIAKERISDDADANSELTPSGGWGAI